MTTPDDITIRVMTIEDHDAVIALWRRTPGVSVRDADSRESIARYLDRNPDLSFVALDAAGSVRACLMSGHDGRRGYLQHLVVDPDYRRRGLARTLVARCLTGLAALGIVKCHIDVLKTNAPGAAWWKSQGWQLRGDIDRYSFISDGTGNA